MCRQHPISCSPNYLLRCTVADKRGKTNIVFELEVCHLPRMDLIGWLICYLDLDIWIFYHVKFIYLLCDKFLAAIV